MYQGHREQGFSHRGRGTMERAILTALFEDRNLLCEFADQVLALDPESIQGKLTAMLKVAKYVDFLPKRRCGDQDRLVEVLCRWDRRLKLFMSSTKVVRKLRGSRGGQMLA